MRPLLLALDLDDTTLDRESRLSSGNREALLRATEMGIQLVIASGRAFDTLPRELVEFPGVHYAICSNGATVCETATGQTLLRRTLPPRAVDEILRLTEGAGITYEAFVEGRAYCDREYIAHPEAYGADAATAAYVRSARRPVENITEFIRKHRQELEAVDLVVRSPEQKRAMTELMGQVDDVYITSSAPRLVELSHRDCGKHRALEFLCTRLGIPREGVVAFGNGDNDREMLAWAGVGVAVANGTPLCRDAADMITGNHWEDGVAAALEKLLYIPEKV